GASAGLISTVAFTGANPIILSGAAVNLNGTNNTLTVANTGGVTLSGLVSGAGALTKTGASTLFLTDNTGAASTYIGQTNINQGIVNVQSSTGLGASTATVVAGTGAALQLQGGITLARALTLNGTGVGGTGAVENLSGINIVSGAIALN